jgi:hypothetical protein
VVAKAVAVPWKYSCSLAQTKGRGKTSQKRKVRKHLMRQGDTDSPGARPSHPHRCPAFETFADGGVQNAERAGVQCNSRERGESLPNNPPTRAGW